MNASEAASGRWHTASALLALGALLVSMASYQCGAALAKQLFPVVGAQGATAYRLGLGSLILILLRRPWRTTRTGGDWRALWGYGLSTGAMNLVFYMSLRTIPLGVAVALEFTGPLALAVFSSRKVVDFLWIGLALFGLAELLPLRQQIHGLDPAGTSYALAAGVGWVLYIVLGKKAGAAYGGDAVALGMSVAALLTIPFGVAHAGSALLAPALLPAGLGVAVLSCALPYTLEMVALTRMPAKTFGTLLSMEPGLAALSGVVFLGEHLGAAQWLAMVAIMIASGGSAFSARSAMPEAPMPLTN